MNSIWNTPSEVQNCVHLGAGNSELQNSVITGYIPTDYRACTFYSCQCYRVMSAHSLHCTSACLAYVIHTNYPPSHTHTLQSSKKLLLSAPPINVFYISLSLFVTALTHLQSATQLSS